MEREASVRSVERAIALLRALNQAPVSTLEALNQLTQIPKSTLVRLLRTLEEQGLVARGARAGEYRLLDGVTALSSGYHHVPRIIQTAAPIVKQLTREIKWPIAVALLQSDALVVRYSTIPYSPLALLHSSINMRVSLVSRALGRAYLAFCTPEEQEMLLAMVRNSEHVEDQVARNTQAVETMLRQIKQQGYAMRDPALRPISGTLAVPIMADGHVAASMGLTWITSALTNEQVIERYLPQLINASQEISTRLRLNEQA